MKNNCSIVDLGRIREENGILRRISRGGWRGQGR